MNWFFLVVLSLLIELELNCVSVITVNDWVFIWPTLFVSHNKFSIWIIFALTLQTWVWKWLNFFVGDRHDRLTEFLQKVWDGLVGQEDGHGGQQQVDEDEQHSEDIFHAGFTESHRRTAPPNLILCKEKTGAEVVLERNRNIFSQLVESVTL